MSRTSETKALRARLVKCQNDLVAMLTAYPGVDDFEEERLSAAVS